MSERRKSPREPCPLCEVVHRTDEKARRCIVTHEFEAWMEYICTMPRGSGVGGASSYERYTNHIDPNWYYSWVRNFIRYRDDNRCKHCGVKIYDGEVHHIKPKSKGGLDNPDNLIYICTECHKEHTKKLCAKKVRGGEVLANPYLPVQQRFDG